MTMKNEEDAMRRDLGRTFLMPALLGLPAFVPAVLGILGPDGNRHIPPMGTVVGKMHLDGVRGDVPFTGTFFLPFALDASGTAYYLDFNPDNPYHVVPVADNERALGYPTVR